MKIHRSSLAHGRCSKHVLGAAIFATLFGCLATNPSRAAEDGASTDEAPAADDGNQQERFRKFEKTLSGATLEGRFTILGRNDDSLPRERYVIRSVRKLPEGDYWLFQARIKYADKDVTVPLPLEVKWAGDTPVITLTKLTIPGLGTFSSRVVIYNNKYAGTWTHDDAGGHLFGVIKRPDSEP
jgi:hypothetical protein